MNNLTFTFIDICYADYLSDHHTGENEQLICSDWYEDITQDDLVRDLIGNTLVCENDNFLALLPYSDEEAVKLLRGLIQPQIQHLDLSMKGMVDTDGLMCYGFFKW